MKEQLNACEGNIGWIFVDAFPSNKTLVLCKWVLKIMLESDNRVLYRARLIVKVSTQKPGIDYHETSSAVVSYYILRMLLALSVQLDVKKRYICGLTKRICR